MNEEIRKYAQILNDAKKGYPTKVRSELITSLMKHGSFINIHHTFGMNVRNYLRKECPEIKELEQTIEHFLDNNWQQILLYSLNLSKEEFNKIPLREWLTSDNDCVRKTALFLQENYNEFNSL